MCCKVSPEPKASVEPDDAATALVAGAGGLLAFVAFNANAETKVASLSTTSGLSSI